MIEKYDQFKPLPISDPMVSYVWQEFVDADYNLKVESIRRRGWYVLLVVESVITYIGDSFIETLYSLGVEELILCFGEGSAQAPDKAGSVQLDGQGHLVLQDAAFVSSYFFIDRRQQFCGFQMFTDMYLLAGDLEFIESVQNCSFKTSFEMTLNIGLELGESEADPGWIFKTCQRYSSVIPPGLTCTPTVVSKESLINKLVVTNIALPHSVAALTETREGIRVFSPQTLRNRDWSCIPIIYPNEDFIFSWAPEAERFAGVAKREGYTRLEGYLFESAHTFNAYQAPATREGMLAFAVLMSKEDIIVTGNNADFAMLGSAKGFVLVVGPKNNLLRIGGHPSNFPDWIYDSALHSLEDDAPQVEEVLSEVFLEYMELD